MLKVGNYIPAAPDKPAVIERAWHGQGDVVIDEDAFLNHPDQVCYVPELSDSVYTRLDLLALCNGQEELVSECFYGLDWQHPESWLEEQFACGEWQYASGQIVRCES